VQVVDAEAAADAAADAAQVIIDQEFELIEDPIAESQ
jgi:hypothetical protein